MAIKSTIFRLELEVADMDRDYYASHTLTVARNPSETDERMMVRVVAFALNAHERLVFGTGLSTEDEPDLWRHGLSGEIEQWIDVGLPDERRLRKASGRAREVIAYLYGGSRASAWWEANAKALAGRTNVAVYTLPGEQTPLLADLATRGASLQCNIQDGTVYLIGGDTTVEITPVAMNAAS